MILAPEVIQQNSQGNEKENKYEYKSSSAITQEEDKSLPFLNTRTLNEKLTLVIMNIDKLNLRKSRLEAIYDELNELSNDKGEAKVLEYT